MPVFDPSWFIMNAIQVSLYPTISGAAYRRSAMVNQFLSLPVTMQMRQHHRVLVIMLPASEVTLTRRGLSSFLALRTANTLEFGLRYLKGGQPPPRIYLCDSTHSFFARDNRGVWMDADRLSIRRLQRHLLTFAY
jgi:hypothetical protein